MNQTEKPVVPMGVPMNELRSLAEMLPQPYQEIDSKFLNEQEEVLTEMKNLLKDFGGLSMVGADDMLVLSRIPSRENLTAFTKKSESAKDGLESNMILIRQCVLYPTEQVIREWDRVYPGITTVIANGMLDLAKVGAQPVVKKL